MHGSAFYSTISNMSEVVEYRSGSQVIWRTCLNLSCSYRLMVDNPGCSRKKVYIQNNPDRHQNLTTSFLPNPYKKSSKFVRNRAEKKPRFLDKFF